MSDMQCKNCSAAGYSRCFCGNYEAAFAASKIRHSVLLSATVSEQSLGTKEFFAQHSNEPSESSAAQETILPLPFKEVSQEFVFLAERLLYAYISTSFLKKLGIDPASVLAPKAVPDTPSASKRVFPSSPGIGLGPARVGFGEPWRK